MKVLIGAFCCPPHPITHILSFSSTEHMCHMLTLAKVVLHKNSWVFVFQCVHSGILAPRIWRLPNLPPLFGNQRIKRVQGNYCPCSSALGSISSSGMFLLLYHMSWVASFMKKIISQTSQTVLCFESNTLSFSLCSTKAWKNIHNIMISKKPYKIPFKNMYVNIILNKEKILCPSQWMFYGVRRGCKRIDSGV